ncbi:hypothetical protein E4U22_008824 [Claviceps purpurea]|nr:hypothetical protein E4U22_008824 [Claviceps purpurea]
MLADIFPANADTYVSVIERAENFSEEDVTGTDTAVLEPNGKYLGASRWLATHMTVTFYNKTDSQRDSPKIIPRFLPWRAGQLLSSYLVSSHAGRNLVAKLRPAE